MSLIDVEYQGPAQRLLQCAIRSDRVPHAYLFHGPDGVGKETLAAGLAQLLLCNSPKTRVLDTAKAARAGLDQMRAGCGTCDDCRAVAAGTHPDLHLIYRQLNRQHDDPLIRRQTARNIVVEVVREFVTNKVILTPRRGRAKVFIMREADLMTPQAQNALLKTLEEPPGMTFIILLVTSLEKMLPTTLSRCQLVPFDLLPTAFVRQKLAAILTNAPPEQVAWYARCAEGSIGQGLILAQDGMFDVNEQLLRHLLAIFGVRPGGDGGRAALPSHADITGLVELCTDSAKAVGGKYRRRDPDMTEVESQRIGLKLILRLCAIACADILRLRSDRGETIVNAAWEPALRAAAQSPAGAHMGKAIRRLTEAEWHLDRNVHVQLTTETVVHALARLGAPPVAATA